MLLGGAAAQAQQTSTPAPNATVTLEIGEQPLVDALNALARQAGLQLLLDADARTQGMKAPKISGSFTPEAALQKLLMNSKLRYEFLDARTVAIRAARSDKNGVRQTGDAAQLSGAMRLAEAEESASAAGDKANKAQRGRDDVEEMLVEGEREPDRVVAGGNLDLKRSENDPLPFQVFTAEEIRRSGVTDINTFLRRQLLQSDPTTLPSTINPSGVYEVDSSNLNLRGYGSDQTVILVNGRRLPQASDRGQVRTADVNMVPVRLIERIEVLPASASAIYGADAIGGVINIILRPMAKATEFSVSYNNTTRSFDAPESSLSFLHQQGLFDGRMDIRLNATLNRTVPVTEAELGYIRAYQNRVWATLPLTFIPGAATPNLRSQNGSALLGVGTSNVTSVAPGADGSGGLAAFAGRSGVRNFELFDDRDGYYKFGHDMERRSLGVSMLVRPLPWLEVSADAMHDRAQHGTGFDKLFSTFLIPGTVLTNPFGQNVILALQDVPWQLGADYTQAINYTSTAAVGALVKLRADWSVALDAQYSRSELKYRGYVRDSDRWRAMVLQGIYNPFRDTQVHDAPAAFYDQVLYYARGRGEFADFGGSTYREYSLRVTNQSLRLPAGRGALVIGANYGKPEVSAPIDIYRYGDGTPGPSNIEFSGTDLGYNWGIYGELMAPLLPQRFQSSFLRSVQGDIAWRYAGSNTFKQSPNPPTFGLKFETVAGVSLRGVYTSSYRPPLPIQSIVRDPANVFTVNISDPRRGGENYDVDYQYSPQNPDLLPEQGDTTTFGLVWEGRGALRGTRASLDHVYTDKVNEITTVDAITVEQWYPQLVQREAPAPGDPFTVGRVTGIRLTPVNVLGRTSRDWSASLSHSWDDVLGGNVDAYARGFLFQSYKTQLIQTAPIVENINNPDASFPFLKYRASFGARWFNSHWGVGMDGRYYHYRIMLRDYWTDQGSDRVDPYWEFDLYAQAELSRLFGMARSGFELHGQLNIGNVFDTDPPRAVNAGGSFDVQPYGDWRGRTYSLSLTASF